MSDEPTDPTPVAVRQRGAEEEATTTTSKLRECRGRERRLRRERERPSGPTWCWANNVLSRRRVSEWRVDGDGDDEVSEGEAKKRGGERKGERESER